MKQIRHEFRRDNLDCRLVERDGDFAIYHITSGSHSSYELMRVRRYKVDNDFLNLKAGDEYLPSTSEWGSYGWTLDSLNACHTKIQYLKQQYDEQNR